MQRKRLVVKRIVAALMAIMLCFGDVVLPGTGLILAEGIATPTDLSTLQPPPVSATEMPQMTEAPAATQLPAANQTEAPEYSAVPGKSDQPNGTVTETPGPTAEATHTLIPESSVSPEQTMTPEMQEDQEPTGGLECTPLPGITDAPEVTILPEAAPSESPEIQDGLTNTPNPDEIIEPEPTEVLDSVKTLQLLEMNALNRYAVVDSQALQVRVAFADGIAPYALSMEVQRDGEIVHAEEMQVEQAGVFALSWMPEHHGEHEMIVSVTDALGAIVTGQVSVPVAANVYESEDDWAESVAGVHLTGDWRKDLVAIASTQLGVKESSINFMIDEQGMKQGYTRYGHWYGANYSEWCAMFVSFCLHYAGVPAGAFPREAGCTAWKSQLSGMGVYRKASEGYVPEKGDLVFFGAADVRTAEHVGIVCRVTDTAIETIEGNRGHQVQQESYSLDDPDIAGYASMRSAMMRAGILDKYEQIDITVNLRPDDIPEDEQIDVTVAVNTLPENVAGLKAQTNVNAVNLRKEPSTGSQRLGQVKKGTEVTLIAKELVDGEWWLLAEYEGEQVYILGSLLNVTKPEASAAPGQDDGMTYESDDEAGELAVDQTEETGDPATRTDLDTAGDATAPVATVSPVPAKKPAPTAAEVTSEPVATPEPSAAPSTEEIWQCNLGEILALQVPKMERTEYQWQRSLNGTNNWEDIRDDSVALGWNTYELSIIVTKESAEYQYRCLIRQQEEPSGDGLLSVLFGISSACAEEENQWVALPQVFRIMLAEESGSQILMSGYTADLHVYNYLYYSNADGTGLESGGGNALNITGDANADADIFIGDHEQEDADTKPISGHNIAINLAGAQQQVMVYPVNGGDSQVTMNVTSTASIEKLTVQHKLMLTLNGDLYLKATELSDGAVLTINTNGHTLTIGTMDGGQVTIIGSGEVKLEERLNVEQLILRAVTLQGQEDSATVTAGGEITVDGATVRDLALLGFDQMAQGERILRFEGSVSLGNIDALGAAKDCPAMVRVEGLNHVDSTTGSITVSGDHTVTYAETVSGAQTNIEPQTGWVVSYRTSTMGVSGSPAIIGGRVQTENGAGAYTPAADGTQQLPVISRDGYAFKGWLLDGDGDAVMALSGVSGDVTLHAALDAYAVSVTFDLGFDPTDKSNDAPVPPRQSGVDSFFGETLELPSPFRFGHQFLGWKLEGGEDLFKHQYAITSIGALAASGEGETAYSLTFTAVWQPESFVLYMSIPEDIGTLDTVQIATSESPAESDWMTIEAFLQTTGGMFTKSTDSSFVASDSAGILYGESLGDWFERLGQSIGEDWHLPVLRADGSEEFAAWQINGAPVSPGHVMSNEGKYGFLKAQGTTLAAYQSALNTSPIALMANFTDGFSLTVTGLTGDWEVWLRPKGEATAEQLAASNGQIGPVQIPMGAQLLWRLKKSSSSFGRGITPWAFEHEPGFGFDIVEQPYAPASSTYIEYSFTMPHCNLAARLHNDTVWLNLADSPITFEEDHTYNNHTMDGFWYGEKLTELTPIYQNAAGDYFYTWSNADTLHITTENEPTKNQLTLVNALKVVLKACDLQPRDEFLADAVGSKLAGKSAESALALTDTGKYGNIVIDTTANAAYRVDLTIQGENTVGAIIPQRIRTESGYTTTLNITGADNGVLNLGGLWGTHAAAFTSLTINSINTNSDYICAVTSGGEGRKESLTFTKCTINASDKIVSSRYSSVGFSGTNADVYETLTYGGLSISGNSVVRVRKDARSNHCTLSLAAGSVLVVDGSLTYKWDHWNSGATVNGTLIVKGARCDLGNLSMSNANALVVSNVITLGNRCTVSGGTIVTNQLLNPPHSSITGTTAATSNGDNAHLATWAQNHAEAHVYTFKGGSIYLLGKKYSSADRADASGNPMASILTDLMDDQGNWNKQKVTHDTAYAAVQAAKDTSKECFVLGNSLWTADTTRYRSLSFAGSKIYAAGNITLFNDTTVSKGTIECAGTLTTKHTLKVTGGSITAAGVGNAYNITTLEDGMYRYAKTSITGGTLKVDSIGAVGPVIASVQPCGVITISDNANITGRSGDTVYVRSVLYTNYVGSTDAFEMPSVPGENPRHLVFAANIPNDSMTFEGQLQMDADAVFAVPTLAGTDVQASWAYGSVDGTITEKISAEGYVNGTDQDGYVYEGHDYVALYAKKNSYPVKVQGSYNGGFTVSATDVSDSLTANGTLDVPVGKTVTIVLDDAERYNRTIVWYVDAAGVPVNVMSLDGAVMNEGNRTFTFPMPSYDVEVWITQEMRLDLFRYPVSVTGDGFRVEWSSQAERSFAYAGDLRLSQSNIKQMKVLQWNGYSSESNVVSADGSATTNYFRFESGSDDLDRVFTLERIMQTGGNDNVGNQLAEGESISLVVDGIVQLAHILVPQTASVDIAGISGQHGNDKRDVLYVYQPNTNNHDNYAIGNGSGMAGNISLRDLCVLSPARSTMGYSKTKNNNAVFLMENCRFVNNYEYTYSAIIQRMGTVRFVNSNVGIITNTGHSDMIISGVSTMEVIDSTITYTFGTTTGLSRSFFNGAAKVVLDHSSVDLTWRASGSSTYLYEYRNSYEPEYTLKNGASITSNYRQMFKKLTVESGSSVIISGDGSETAIFCNDLTVSGGSVQADNIILSGYYYGEAKNKTAVLAALQSGTNVTASGTLNLTGGEVKSTNFVGGDANAVINVTGGTLSAERIGTSGLLYGFAQYMPAPDEPYFYTTSAYDANAGLDLKAQLNIGGGTVNVLQGGCIGGVNTSINVTGGLVQLASGSVMGMNAEQENAYLLYRQSAQPASAMISGGKVEHTGGCVLDADAACDNGSIRMSYGSVEISGMDTGVHVHDLTAEGGSIFISDTGNEYYDNPYTGEDIVDGDQKINVRVDRLLQAGTKLEIIGASVYAHSAYVNPAPGATAEMNIIPMGSDVPALYLAGEYGKAPESAGNAEIEKISHSFVHGAEYKAVTYVLNETMCAYPDSYAITNSNVNGYSYVKDSAETIALADPVWPGRVFQGWYTQDDFAPESCIEELCIGQASGYVLYAKWAFDTVRFSVTVPSALQGLTNEEVFAAEREGIGGYWNDADKTFTFRRTVEIPYGSSIVSGLALDTNYQLTSVRVNSVKYREESYADVEVNEVIPGVYELYQQKKENQITTQVDDDQSEVTIELLAAGTVKKRLFLTLDLNLQNGYPVDAAFPAGQPNASTATTWTSPVETGKDVSDAAAFVVNGAMVEPTAPGYEFLGWYEQGSDTALTPDTVPTEQTTYYAKWEPKTYLISFDAGEDNMVTADGSLPAEGAPQILYALIRYDAPLNEMICVTEEGGLWKAEAAANGKLPAGWKQGAAFAGWTVGNAVTAETLFNKTTLGDQLDLTRKAVQIGDSWDAETSATFAAQYNEATVTFHGNGGYVLSGGKLLTELPLKEREHDPFMGYTRLQDGESYAGYTAVVQQTCDCSDQTPFAVLSTTHEAFADNGNTHLQDDYRHTVQRAGYTFCGWYASPEAAASAVASGDYSGAQGTMARYPSSTAIDLYAAWAPNTYTVTLKEPKEQTTYSQYSGANAVTAAVTVGDEISVTAWPEQGNAAWYAYNKDEGSSAEAQRRYLLGFTFDQLDPGDSRQGSSGYATYQTYAKTITGITNAGCIFRGPNGEASGTVFKIPLREYTPSAVPDYPNGAAFDLYAVYRERSLVFIERYVKDGVTHEKVLSSGPVDTYSDYPAAYTTDANGSYAALRAEGFTLKYWAVNGSANTKYPGTAADYAAQLDTFKTTATNKGVYDVNVYTVFSANLEEDRTLMASTSPLDNHAFARVVLPGSIHAAQMNYSLTLPEGIKLVEGDELDLNRFTPAWDGGNANDTVAVWLELKNSKGEIYAGQWLKPGEKIPMGEASASGGWQIELTMYHSSVISQEESWLLPISFGFVGESDQSLLLNAEVVLKPTLYKLNYQVAIPDGAAVMDGKNFQAAQNGATYLLSKSNVPYGSSLIADDAVPTVEGYSWDGSWSSMDGSWSGNSFTLPVTEADAGVITLKSGYSINSYPLISDTFTRGHLFIYAGGEPVDDDEANVQYGETVRLYGSPEKLYITRGDVTRTVDEWIAEGFVTKENNGYSFIMPAEAVTLDAYAEKEASAILTACESTHACTADETDTFTFGSRDGLRALAGKQLYLRSVETNGINLELQAQVEAIATTAGSDYANSTFALTVALDDGNEQDVRGVTNALGEITQASQLTFTLHNANALTIPGQRGSIRLIFATSADLNETRTDLVTIDLAVHAVPAQINVAVPLVIVMKTNVDGGSAEVRDQNYGIDNDSSMRVQLTGLSVAAESDRMTQADDAADLSTLRDAFRVERKADWMNQDLYADGETGERYNPLERIAVSPLSFVTRHGEDIGEHMATITYTIGIPAANKPPGEHTE